MKRVFIEIEVIAYFDEKGKVRPYRFRYEYLGEKVIVVVDRIIHSDIDMFCGNPMLIYDCSAEINKTKRVLQLKYEVKTHRWYLTKL